MSHRMKDYRKHLRKRKRLHDDSKEIIFQGQLCKLNTNGDPKDAADWLLPDMWIANNGSICYYSQKESKRLVLLEASKFHDATIEALADVARPFAFVVQFGTNDEQHDSVYSEFCRCAP